MTSASLCGHFDSQIASQIWIASQMLGCGWGFNGLQARFSLSAPSLIHVFQPTCVTPQINRSPWSSLRSSGATGHCYNTCGRTVSGVLLQPIQTSQTKFHLGCQAINAVIHFQKFCIASTRYAIAFRIQGDPLASVNIKVLDLAVDPKYFQIVVLPFTLSCVP